MAGHEISAGHQSRVFHAELRGERTVVKLQHRQLADAGHLTARMEMLAGLADTDDRVVGPIAVASSLVNRVGEWLAVVFPYVAGRHPDITSHVDVAAMAAALPALHRALAASDGEGIPAVAALAANPASGDGQLIHGDYAAANVVLTRRGARILDFDDCGHATVDFELGNTLYMVLFDATLAGDRASYERFRRWFVDEYRAAGGRPVADAVLDAAIALRVDALRGWLDEPERSPVGIRTASPEWRRRLRAFTDDA